MARKSTRLGSLVLFLGALFPLASAKECVFEKEVLVHSQSELDTQTKDCTTVNGSIAIAADFSGPLTLSGVSIITDKFYSAQIDSEEAGNHGLTSIEMKDVKAVGTLAFGGSYALRSISLPDLEFASWMGVDGWVVDTLDFPSLTNADEIHLFGNLTGLEFPLLNNVTIMRYDGRPSMKIPRIDSSPLPFEANFPALKICKSLVIYGNVTSFAIPELAEMDFLDLDFQGPLLPVSLPHVKTIGSISLQGNIKDVSLPVLSNVTSTLRITSDVPLNLNLSSVQAIDKLDLQGNITSVSLESLSSFDSIKIHSLLPNMDCTSAVAAFERVKPTEAKNPQGANSIFTCSGTETKEEPQPTKKPNSGSRSSVDLGLTLSLALGIPVLVALS